MVTEIQGNTNSFGLLGLREAINREKNGSVSKDTNVSINSSSNPIKQDKGNIFTDGRLEELKLKREAVSTTREGLSGKIERLIQLREALKNKGSGAPIVSHEEEHLGKQLMKSG